MHHDRPADRYICTWAPLMAFMTVDVWSLANCHPRSKPNHDGENNIGETKG